ncbi:hypothetical protein [Pinirhizobacter sp.]|jgi:hypothetical protein|uniref:hypothetical protein n=1 Tax=Pinirhizobacter sp. TaxID=2950432 RepID=UPI002F40E953
MTVSGLEVSLALPQTAAPAKPVREPSKPEHGEFSRHLSDDDHGGSDHQWAVPPVGGAPGEQGLMFSTPVAQVVASAGQASHDAVLAGVNGRLFPFGVHAGAYLSEVDPSTPETADESATLGQAALMPLGFISEAAVASLPEIAKSPVQTGRPAGTAMSLVAPTTGTEAAAAEEEVANTQANNASIAVAPWSPSLLRVVDGAHGRTVWLRDFHLDADGVDEASRRLAVSAGGSSRPVARVVINGQETWRADSAPTNKGQGNGS